MTYMDLLENYLVIKEIGERYNQRQKELEEINILIKSIKEESGDD